MTVKAEVEKQDKFLALINLEIPADQATQEYNKACRRLGQRVNIPGFRRGKAPRGVVEKAVGIERIKQEALDRLLPPAFADVISEHQLDIVAPPQIEQFNFDLNQGVTVKAQVELRPETELPDFSRLKVKVPRFEIPEDAEEKELQNLVERMTTLETVIDRPTKETDIVNIDFSGTMGGNPIRGGSARNYRLDLANNNFIEGFADQLVGHKIGEDFSISVTFPQDYHDKELAGKEAEFKVKINEIKEKIVPELTDDLAAKIGPYDSVDQLKKEVGKLLKENEDRENEFRKQKALIEAIVQEADVEIPDNMVNREAKLLMEEVKQRLRSQGHSWEQFLDSQGHETMWENLRQEARQRIKTSLVFGAIARQEGITVTEDEFSNQVRELAAMTNQDEKQVMRQLANNVSAAQSMNDQILSQKIVDYLSERADFEFVTEEEAKKTEKPRKAEVPASGPELAAVAQSLEGEEFEVIEEEE